MATVERIKTIGNWMMLIGGCIFTGGAGMNITASIIEHGNRKRSYEKQKIADEKAAMKLRREKKIAEIEAQTAKDAALAERLKTMNNKEFAKYHAECVAKANDDVLAKAEQTRKLADYDISKMKLECSDKIMAIEKECSQKIEEANEKYLEAKRKYEAINELFENKDEILQIKNELETLTSKKEAENEAKDELAKKIAVILG